VGTFTEIWAKVSKAFTDIYDFVDKNITGPNGFFAQLVDWLSNKLSGPIDFAKGVIKGAVEVWQGLADVLNTIIGFLKDIIEFAGKAAAALLGVSGTPENPAPKPGRTKGAPRKFGEDFGEGITGGIAGGIQSLSGGLTGLVAAMTAVFEKFKSLSITDPLLSFTSAIMGRFKSKIVGPLEDRSVGLQEALDAVNEALASADTSYEERMNLEAEKARLDAEYLRVSQQLTIEKERELALQKQLDDLAFLQAQMDFLSFLRENELSMADILGDLQLGLNLDLPAFMDAITRALAALVAGLNSELSGTPPTGFAGGGAFAGAGKPLGGGMQVYNNQAVNIYFSATLNNGMDYETFKVGVLDVVKGALA
jgi:hypothetical protein